MNQFNQFCQQTTLILDQIEDLYGHLDNYEHVAYSVAKGFIPPTFTPEQYDCAVKHICDLLDY